GCGEVDLQIYKYNDPATPLTNNGHGLSEAEPVVLSPTPSGFIVGGYVPPGASLVTLTTAYGVRTFNVSGASTNGAVWGGFIDFPNVAHGASFSATITSDTGGPPLDVTLTRP